MAWAATVVAGVSMATSIAGGIGAGSDADDAKLEGDVANANAQNEATANKQWNMEQYDSQLEKLTALEATFGTIQDNLANYYSNVSPELHQLMGKEAIENQYKRSQDTMDAFYSNNGMFGSGQRLSAQLALESHREMNLGQNRMNSNAQWRADQQQWLNYGNDRIDTAQAQANQFIPGINNASQQIQSQFNNQANQAYEQQGNYEAQASAAWSSAGQSLGQIAGTDFSGAFGGQTSLPPKAPNVANTALASGVSSANTPSSYVAASNSMLNYTPGG